ncbi:MAG: hypothetical protein KBT14_01930, partial [Proteobacteria bacterium]|nr:hypothetical protein [Candidatus Enterousia onthequi]
YKIRPSRGVVSQKNLGFWYTMHKGKNLRNSKEKSKYRESKKMHKKHIFLRVFQKIALFACVFCAFFISPVFATLPAGYTELEYIESTGTQYIDTGLEITTNYAKAKAKITPLGYNSITRPWGIQGAQNICFTAWDKNSSSHPDGWLALGSDWYVGKSSSTFFNTSLNVPYEFDFEADNGSASGVYAGETFSTTYAGTLINTGNIYLFKCNKYSGGASKTRIHYFEMTTAAGSRNFIPAKRDSDGEVGMYDTVSGTFFTNSGTGEFIAGPVAEIKIATTKYVDEEFAAAEAKLATTVQTIESVVSRTITQTGQIATLHETKQTRPDESCPANMKCLLVQDEDGAPHWYPIIEP